MNGSDRGRPHGFGLAVADRARPFSPHSFQSRFTNQARSGRHGGAICPSATLLICSPRARYPRRRLACVPFRHEHIFDASQAPRGQLPYIIDDGETIGDSETIIDHVIRKYRLTIDAALTAAQCNTSFLITRMLDDLYWVMSYSRWKDERYWPAFRDALLREHPRLMEEGLRKAKEHNSQRYHFQGIGRYEPDAAMARGLADLRVLADLIPAGGYVHGKQPSSIDAGIYGFVANIYFYDIDTPLKQFVVAHDNMVRYCRAIHGAVSEHDLHRAQRALLG